MAQKTRTPDPPRKVQAPKLREHRATPAEQQRTRMILFSVAGLGILGLAVAIGLFVFAGGGSSTAREAIEGAGGTLQQVESLEATNHVQAAPERSAYNTWPPTSGPHHPEPTPYLVFDEPVEQFRLVHNLEHGGIIIQYGSDIPQEQVDAMAAWWRNDPNGIIIAPFPDLGDEITLSAWTAPSQEERGTSYLARLPRFDEEAFDAFKDAYGFRGPERFPRELLTPDT